MNYLNQGSDRKLLVLILFKIIAFSEPSLESGSRVTCYGGTNHISALSQISTIPAPRWNGGLYRTFPFCLNVYPTNSGPSNNWIADPSGKQCGDSYEASYWFINGAWGPAQFISVSSCGHPKAKKDTGNENY